MSALAQRADAAPNYHIAMADAPATCAACRFFVDGKCQAYDFACEPTGVCDAFEATPALDDPNLTGSRTIGVPPLPDGQRSIDDARGEFTDRGERGVN
jgi:hypothetical protein